MNVDKYCPLSAKTQSPARPFTLPPPSQQLTFALTGGRAVNKRHCKSLFQTLGEMCHC